MKIASLALTIASLIPGISALLPILNEEMTNLFEAWQAEHGHRFSSLIETEKRLITFIKNVEMIVEHNNKFERGEVSYDLALNQYAHLTWDEFKAGMMKYKKDPSHKSLAAYTHTSSSIRNGRNLGKTAKSVDWRKKGAVTDVKDQGDCGSCWSFSTTGAIEGAHYLKTGELIPLSEQQLLDCVDGGQFTCDYGGDIDTGFEYVINVGGLVSEDDFPYENIQGGSFSTCKYQEGRYNGDGSDFAASISSYADVTMNDEYALASAVTQQPVSIAIDASDDTFQFFKSGIYEPKSCCGNGECTVEDLDHGVLAVGYGSDSRGEYWIVKNSWGPKWGDKGYVKMAKGKGSKCGVATAASYPIV